MQENLIIEVLYLLNPAVDIGFNISEIADELNVKNADVKAACLALVQDKKIRTSVSCGRNIYYGKCLVLEERPKAQPAPAVELAAVAPAVSIESSKKRGRPRKAEQVKLNKADVELVLNFNYKLQGTWQDPCEEERLAMAALDRLSAEVKKQEVIA